MKNIIKEAFDRDSGHMSGLNNIKVSCGVFTNDEEKAQLKLLELCKNFNKDEIDSIILSKNNKELRLKDGTRYVWIKLINNSKGYRCAKAIIDEKITIEEFKDLIQPICYACGRNDVEVF